MCTAVCKLLSRLPGQEGVYDAFVEAMVAAVKKLKMGGGMDTSTTLGPLISPGAVDRVSAAPCQACWSLLAVASPDGRHALRSCGGFEQKESMHGSGSRASPGSWHEACVPGSCLQRDCPDLSTHTAACMWYCAAQLVVTKHALRCAAIWTMRKPRGPRCWWGSPYPACLLPTTRATSTSRLWW